MLGHYTTRPSNKRAKVYHVGIVVSIYRGIRKCILMRMSVENHDSNFCSLRGNALNLRSVYTSVRDCMKI